MTAAGIAGRQERNKQMWLREFFSNRWSSITPYQRFESAAALVITLLVSLVVVVAIFRLFVGVFVGLVFGALDPLDHRVFQGVFGEIMTVLIALEFNHTLQYVVTRQESIIQTKVIVLIALLAVARKLVIMDLRDTTAQTMLGLAAITLALGIVYWLLRERDDRLVERHRTADSTASGKEA
ncbi:MAG TPA: phosphate-starvation-inducible PsiE family protein [Burkholderiales bacterium]|nr:phosphate-starvation-inducible PsiE family protein [Burkholderiales bacterium]